MKHFIIYNSPAGSLRIVENGTGITNIDFLTNKPENPAEAEEKETFLLQTAAKQLSEYFAGKRTHFDVKLDLHGTDFRKRVWNVLCTIPYGETRTYKQIAECAGCPKGARAVGLANNRNPVSIIVPCHRVIGANGSLTGYAGGLNIKQILLDIEQRNQFIFKAKPIGKK
ncbi:MAG: methylated-DNA--[protein]-cysteine S-methyltransferase [Tannerella sp.]|jgi:methylated-DNA-[protein]-cysteine S-methyltransferase|nr:methylated-DNA--[protein]-cysteine S-methyltransferase [Tannerella sp.]